MQRQQRRSPPGGKRICGKFLPLENWGTGAAHTDTQTQRHLPSGIEHTIHSPVHRYFGKSAAHLHKGEAIYAFTLNSFGLFGTIPCADVGECGPMADGIKKGKPFVYTFETAIYKTVGNDVVNALSWLKDIHGLAGPQDRRGVG